MWLAVASENVLRAREVLDDAWLQGLSEEERSAVAEVHVDLDTDGANCPACGTEFDPSAGRCPDCGLNFGDGS